MSIKEFLKRVKEAVSLAVIIISTGRERNGVNSFEYPDYTIEINDSGILVFCQGGRTYWKTYLPSENKVVWEADFGDGITRRLNGGKFEILSASSTAIS